MSENVNLFGPVLIQVMNVDRVRQVDHFPIRYKISPENKIQTEISLFPFTYFFRYFNKGVGLSVSAAKFKGNTFS